LPSKSNLYGFLDKISVASAEKFGIACAKAFKKEGIFNGRTVNLDGHLISYFGGLKIVKDKHPTRNVIMRGIKAFNLMACLKWDMEGEFEKQTVESFFEEIIAFPALVKAKGDRIVVTFYGNYKEKHRVAVETLLRILDESCRNLPVSWLGNRRIKVRFK
jgi:hypothetical protein